MRLHFQAPRRHRISHSRDPPGHQTVHVMPKEIKNSAPHPPNHRSGAKDSARRIFLRQGAPNSSHRCWQVASCNWFLPAWTTKAHQCSGLPSRTMQRYIWQHLKQQTKKLMHGMTQKNKRIQLKLKKLGISLHLMPWPRWIGKVHWVKVHVTSGWIGTSNFKGGKSHLKFRWCSSDTVAGRNPQGQPPGIYKTL